MEHAILSRMTLNALRALAHELGVDGADAMEKEHLVATLVAAPARADAAATMDHAPGAPGHSVAASQPAQAAPVSPPRLAALGELPERYGITRVVLMVQKPGHLYAYWEVTDADMAAARARAGDNHTLTLRVRDLSGDVCHDIEIHEPVGDWFFTTRLDWRRVRVELGLVTADGRFVEITRSAETAQPASMPSSRSDPKWSVKEGDFESIYALSGGLSERGGSEQIQRILREGWLPSSGGSVTRR